ncbi:MAG: hypothetical protein QOE66_778 [Chloroflexota bacterium]|nr:hypothetical protein [Chloroflexota bacterium]
MAKRGPRYPIDPIEPARIGSRFGALLTRLEPLLDAADVTALRSQIEQGDFETAYARLDALTDAATTEIETAALVELVLLGQAIRPT